MRTTKPISTISFNTKDFLVGKLNELVKAKIITEWYFVEHEPEDDEGGKKKHNHLWILPTKMIQTDDLRDELKEFDPSKPDKPLGCLPFSYSKFDDWYLYACHDKAYLASKGQSRKYHYKYDEFQVSDQDAFNYHVKMVDHLASTPYQAIVDAQSHGITWHEFVARGAIPLPQIGMWRMAWDSIASMRTERNGSIGHPNSLEEFEDGYVVNTETGEIMNSEVTENDEQIGLHDD